MVVALFVFGSLATPVTGLLIRPDVHGARHGNEAIIYLGRFGWYGYVAASVIMVTIALIALRRGTPRGRKLAVSTTNRLRALTVVLGAIHILTVTTGMFHGDGRPLYAVLAATVGVAAVFALVTTRAYLQSV